MKTMRESVRHFAQPGVYCFDYCAPDLNNLHAEFYVVPQDPSADAPLFCMASRYDNGRTQIGFDPKLEAHPDLPKALKAAEKWLAEVQK